MRELFQVGVLLALNLAVSFTASTVVVRRAVTEWFASSPLITLTMNVIIGVMLVAVALWFSRRDASRRSTFGLVALPVRRTIKWAVGVGIASKLAAVPLVIVFHFVHPTRDESMVRAVEHFANGPLAIGIGLSLWAGFWEELIFRGFMLGRLRVACGRWFATPKRADIAAVVIQAFAFGLAHIWQDTEGKLNAAITGMVLGYAALRCGSIIPGMIGHAAIDLLGLGAARSGLGR